MVASAVFTYMAASVGMTIANKRAVVAIHAGTILVGAQLAATCVIVLALWMCRLTRVEGTARAAAIWAPTGLLSGLTLWSGMEALKYASLSTLMVVRNAGPLLLLLAEWLAFGVRPSGGMTASLVVILAGVFLYTWEDLQGSSPEALGLLFIALDMCLVCVGSLLERYLLALRPVELSTGGLVLTSNLVGLLPVALLLAGPCSSELSRLHLAGGGLLWSLATLPGGAAIAYCNILLRRAVSATAALVVTNVDKVLVLAYGVACLGDRMGFCQAAGCTLALFGGACHAWARAASVPPEARDQAQAFLALAEREGAGGAASA